MGCCEPSTPSDNNSGVRSVADHKGTFVQCSTASLLIRITDDNGYPVNPERLEFTITGPDGFPVIIRDAAGNILTGDCLLPQKAADGFFVFEWYIPCDALVGDYLVTWEYDVDMETFNELQTITVSAGGNPTDQYSGMIRDLREAMNHLMPCIQDIPVYREQALPSADCQNFKFTFPRWNQNPRIQIFRNETTIVTEGVEVNYFKGTLMFDRPLLPQDFIEVTYRFRWFSDEELDQFILNAISMYNHTAPFSNYNINTLPAPAVAGILYKATTDALRQMIFCLTLQEPAQVFGGVEAAKSVRADYETLKKNYEGDWKYVFDQKKFGPYPRSRGIVTPSFTLPGGRSRWFRYLFSNGS